MKSKEEIMEGLYEKRDELWKKYWKVCDEITKKEIEQYDFTGKYVKIYGTIANSNPIYMHVENNKVTYKPGDKTKERYILLQGHGFKSCFGEYTDSNYADYTQWWDTYVKLNDFLRYEEMRKTMKITPDDFSYICNSITEITKDEYYNEFRKLIKGMIDAFYKYEKDNSEIELDEEKICQYHEDARVKED